MPSFLLLRVFPRFVIRGCTGSEPKKRNIPEVEVAELRRLSFDGKGGATERGRGNGKKIEGR